MVSPTQSGSGQGGDPRTIAQIIQAALSEQKEKDYRAQILREKKDAEAERISDEKNKLIELENLARAQQEAQRVEIERAEQAAKRDAEILASRASVPTPTQTAMPSGGSAYAPSYGSPFTSSFTRNGAPSGAEEKTEKVAEDKGDLIPLIIAGSALLLGGVYYFYKEAN